MTVPHHCPSTAVKSNLVNARCHCAIAVVALIGVVSLGEPAMLVLQYCDKGSLLGILRKSAPEKEDTDEDGAGALNFSDDRASCVH